MRVNSCISIKSTNHKETWLSFLKVRLYSCYNRDFHIRTEMPIVAFSSSLDENKNESSDKMIALVGIEPGPSYCKSNMESEGPGSIPTFYHRNCFCFHTVKTKMPQLSFLWVCEKLYWLSILSNFTFPSIGHEVNNILKIACKLHLKFIKVDVNFKNSFQIIFLSKKLF